MNIQMKNIIALNSSGTVTGDKTVNPTDIQCNGTTTVTLSLTGQTGISGTATDIMLVLDRSGSMSGTPLADLKTAANIFVDMIDEATDGLLDGLIANGSRIGVVSFATDATLNVSLTSDASLIKSSINGLVAGGLTNHEDAISLAQSQLAAGGSSNRIMIIMTDGQTTIDGNGQAEATDAKLAGTEIYAIGLGSVNVSQLNGWATDPDADYVFITPDSSELEQIFEAIGAAIVVPAATNISVVDSISDHYTIDSSSITASKGSFLLNGNSVQWTIDKLNTETVTLSFDVTHDNTKSGCIEYVNISTNYSDNEGHQVIFPNPTINVHGCAAKIELTPKIGTNTVGSSHTVTSTVTDCFGAPVNGVTVDFSVTGGNSIIDGEPSNPSPAFGSAITNASGQVTFNYTNTEAVVDTITATVPVQAKVSVQLSDTATKTWNPIQAYIDIKPGSFPNSFGANSKGKIPVALLGSSSFNVMLVDDSTVHFGDAPTPFGDAAATDNNISIEDVNNDGFMDKVYHFNFIETNLDPSDVMGCLGGEINGLDFLGCDSVNITPK